MDVVVMQSAAFSFHCNIFRTRRMPAPRIRSRNRLEHVLHVGQCRADLFGNRAMAARTSLRIDRNHAGQKYIVADVNARNVRQVGAARGVEEWTVRLDRRVEAFPSSNHARARCIR
jgi:hypothetical protein